MQYEIQTSQHYSLNQNNRNRKGIVIMKMKKIFLAMSLVIFSNAVFAQFNTSLKIDYFGQTPPGKTAVVFSPDFICTPGVFVQNCCFSADGKEFVYVITDKDWSSSTIMYTKYENGNWTKPDTLHCPVYSGIVPYFSYDGKDLYMVLCQYNNTPSADIYVCHRTANGWGEPIRLDSTVNSDANEWEVCISQNNTLYFSSARPGGFGDMDICTAHLVNGEFTNFHNLGVPINTSSKDECPYIAPDESFMVFNDWKYNPHFKGNNLYITYKKQDGSWTNPKDLGAGINTDLLDIYPYITPDGKYLIYTRRDGASPAASSKLYWVKTDFVDSLRHTNFNPYCKNPIPSFKATVGVRFTFQLDKNTFIEDFSDENLKYTVKLSNGDQLPNWLTFDPSSLTFKGIPDEAQTIILRVSATDKFNESASTDFCIEIGNLSLQGKAISSSNKSDGYPAQNAIDGDPSTRWASKFSDPQWLKIELDSIYVIGKIVINWENAFAKKYEIQTSIDDKNWKTVYSIDSGKGGRETLLFKPDSAKYVKLIGSERATNYGYSIYEFEIYRSDGLKYTENKNR